MSSYACSSLTRLGWRKQLRGHRKRDCQSVRKHLVHWLQFRIQYDRQIRHFLVDGYLLSFSGATACEVRLDGIFLGHVT